MGVWRMGLDAGSTTTKGVLLDPDGRVTARALRPTEGDVRAAADAVRQALLDRAGLGESAPLRVVATGYGRALLPWADRAVTEITCHARGAGAACPGTRLVIEVGGQDAKAIRLGPDGSVEDFAMNDRCAAGTGAFLSVIARRFRHTVGPPPTRRDPASGSDEPFEAPSRASDGGDSLPDRGVGFSEDDAAAAVWSALAAGRPPFDAAAPGPGPAPSADTAPALEINATCVVFAESEVVGLVARGEAPGRVLWAVARSAASRISLLARQVGGGEPALFCGGGALNAALSRALSEALGFELAAPEAAQYNGAHGAALLA